MPIERPPLTASSTTTALKEAPIKCARTRVWNGYPPMIVDQFWSEPGVKPAVLFLAGANGVNRKSYLFAHALARSGFRTFVPHYLVQTRTAFADEDVCRELFPVWLRSLSEVLAFIMSHPEVRESSVGVVGVSLGGTLALTLPARTPGIGAIAEMFGELPDSFAWRIPNMPPTLFVHGGCDPHIPLARVLDSARRMQDRGAHCRIRIYSGERHLFGRAAIVNAVKEVEGFLHEHL